VMALLGRRVPPGLKLFLLTLAVVDDLGAIAVIAVFYSDPIRLVWLTGGGAVLVVVLTMRRTGLASPWAFVIPALVLWVCLFESGVHATVAGVTLGLLTPAQPVNGRAVLEGLERRLHPWTSFVIVPVFALANVGVSLRHDAIGNALSGRVAWAVVIALVLGKPVGIAAFTFLGLRLRLGEFVGDVPLASFVGAAALGGIGFTVSLFVTELAFPGGGLNGEAKIGVLLGSSMAGLAGGALLLLASRASPRRAQPPARPVG
jgi:NhaA family Na+:H+ antiporter